MPVPVNVKVPILLLFSFKLITLVTVLVVVSLTLKFWPAILAVNGGGGAPLSITVALPFWLLVPIIWAWLQLLLCGV